MFLKTEKNRLKMDEVINKAFTTGDLTGGELNPEQASKFVEGAINESVITKECRREPMKADKVQIDKITYSGTTILQKPEAVGTAHTTVTEPTTSKVTLSAEEVIVALDMAYETLEDNIEGQGLLDTVIRMTDKEAGYELDKLMLNGDKSGGTADYLEILDGIFHQISTHTVDNNGVTLSDTVLFNMLKAFPQEYMRNEADLRFYVSHLARLDYIKSLGDKNVDSAFIRYVLENNKPAYLGIPIVKVPAIVTENLGTGSTAYTGSKALLINPKNIIMGVHRDITYEFQRQPRKRVIEVTMTMKLDVKLEEETAAVKGTEIKHS